MYETGTKVRIASISRDGLECLAGKTGMINEVKIDEASGVKSYYVLFEDAESADLDHLHEIWWEEEQLYTLQPEFKPPALPGQRKASGKKETTFPSTGQAVLMLVALLGIQMVGGVAISILEMALGYDENSFIYIWGVLMTVMIADIIVFVYGKRRAGISIKELLKKQSIGGHTIRWVFALFIGWWLTNISLMSLAVNYSKTLSDASDDLTKTMTSLAGSVFGVLYIVLIGPFLEELIFRGIIVKGMIPRYGAKKAIFVSALLFGIAHFSPVQSIAAFGTGIILGIIYLKTGSLRICILIHILNNVTATIAGNLGGMFNLAFILGAGLLILIISLIKMKNHPNRL